MTSEEVLRKFKAKHGDTYIYDESLHYDSDDTVDINCREHGMFKQNCIDHYNGGGCPACAKIKRGLGLRLKQEAFIEKSIDRHGSRYDYSRVNCTGSKNKVAIICREHGEFLQVPSYHLDGNGCPSCKKSGFNPQKQSYFYVNRVGEDALKYGISNNEPRERLLSQQRSTDLDVEHIVSFRGDGFSVLQLENIIKSNLGGNFLNKEQLRDGFTETLPINKLNELMVIISNFMGTCHGIDRIQ